MKKLQALLSAALAIALLMNSSSYAVTLLDEDFSDDDRTNTNLPDEAAFYVGAPDNVSFPSSGGLRYDITGSSTKAHTYFAEGADVSRLSVGDTLSVAVSIIPRVSIQDTSTSRSFRWGVFHDPTDPKQTLDTNDDGGGGDATTAPFDPWQDAEGYGVQILTTSDGATTSAPFDLGKRIGGSTSLIGSSGAYEKASGGAPVAMSANTEYTYTMSITKDSLTQTTVSISIADATGVLSSHTVVDGVDLTTGSTYDDFDFIHFRWSNEDQTSPVVDITRILVEGPALTAVPEPSTMLMSLLATVSLGAVRRRK